MSSIILTSNPGFYSVGDNGKKKAIKLANTMLVETLKKEVEEYDNLLFVCASSDDYKKNEEIVEVITRSLYLAGIKFHMTDMIDSRNWLFSKGLINNSNLIILLDGDCLEQMEFFNGIELKEKLKKYKGCIMGIGSGTINLANKAYCSKKSEEDESSIRYRGLGITDISVEIGFNDSDTKRIEDILLPDSKISRFIALPNESFIVVKKQFAEVYGDAYYFNGGSYKKIGKNINDIYGRE